MQTREVIPFKGKLALTLNLPGSKSITNRVFLCAALAEGKTRIYGSLKSDDAEVMLQALKQFGVKVRETREFIEICGSGGKFKGGKFTLDLHNAGTATRFLTAVSVLRKGETVITGNERMQERPIADLVDGLRQMGVRIEYLRREGCPPILIKGGERNAESGGSHTCCTVKMRGDKSSQYFSALLMMGPMFGRPLRIEVVGDLVSKPYIDTTIAVMRAFGVKVKNNAYKSFEIRPQKYRRTDYSVEGDASSASYFSALQFLHGGKLRFTNLNVKKSIQGDVGFSEALNKLRTGNLRTIDMGAMPDAAMTLAVCASFAKGATKITGLSTLRIKETDRLEALKNELGKVGVRATTTKDSIAVKGGISARMKSRGFKLISTYNDHRMAMCFAVLGTMVPGVVIENPGCTEKTYPNFWEDLEKMYQIPIKLGQKNLLLTGMRCSGKTRHGKRLAKGLGRKFVDLDVEIENAEKMKIEKIVALRGWPYFRKIEQKLCSEFSDQKNLVIASGGGVVLDAKNMKALKKSSVNIFLFADPGILFERILKDQGRPSLTGKKLEDEIHEIWEQRRDLYLKYADYILDLSSGKH